MSDEDVTFLDFSEDITDAEQPDPLPSGDYPATIKQVNKKTSQNGNDFLAVQLLVATEDFPPDFDASNAPNGKVLTFQPLMVDDSLRSRYNIKKFCEAIGAPTGKRIDLTEWIEQSCVIEVDHREYQGEMRENVRRVKAA